MCLGGSITGGAEMPIRRYVEKGVVFAPQALSAMSKALEATTEILGIEGDEAKRQAVAKFIIRLAREDDSLDAAELRDRAVAALGGVAYFAIAQARQSPNPPPKRRRSPLRPPSSPGGGGPQGPERGPQGRSSRRGGRLA